MKVKVKKLDLTLLTLPLTISCAAYSTSLILSQQAKITIKIDGSSTVYPITQGIVKKYQADPNKKVQFAVKISVTIGGFEKLVLYKCGMILWIFLCVFALQSLERGEPLQRSALYSASQKSGTFDYFTEATVGKIRASRNDYTASEDDRVLVNDIIKDPNTLGYFGYAYYEKHQNKLKALAIDNGKGAVLPSRQMEWWRKFSINPLLDLYLFTRIFKITKTKN